MTVCPHCVALGLGALACTVPFIPTALRNFRSKFGKKEKRQSAMVENLGTLYGKEHASSQEDR